MGAMSDASTQYIPARPTWVLPCFESDCRWAGQLSPSYLDALAAVFDHLAEKHPESQWYRYMSPLLVGGDGAPQWWVDCDSQCGWSASGGTWGMGVALSIRHQLVCVPQE